MENINTKIGIESLTKICANSYIWKNGRQLTAYECCSGNCIEIVYAPNELEASKFFSSQYPKKMIVKYVKPITVENMSKIQYRAILN